MNWVEGQLLQSGKYRIKRQIGGGGFGLTYLAEELTLVSRVPQREVVIKAPNRTLQDDLEYEKFIKRFQLEGQRLAKISHPNVVGVLGFFQESGVPCLVMEYVAGETLSALVKRQGCLSEGEALLGFEKLAEVLQAVHGEGLIHCDVQPSNIMLQRRFELHPGSDDPFKGKFVLKPVLIDFGSAKSLQPSTLTVTTTVNDFYAPYEQLERLADSEPHQTWDVYALAATLYFAVVREKPPSPRSRRGRDLLKSQLQKRKLNKELSRAILRGMAMKPKDRPQSMKAWMELLTPQPPFPWAALGFLMLGYVLIGLHLGLTNISTGALAWIAALALAWIASGAGGLTASGAGGWSLTMAWAWAVATLVASWVGDGAWTPLVVGLAAWAVMFAGVASGAMFASGALDNLSSRYRPRVVFFIWASISTFGLALGGGVCWWWLKLNGVKLPL